MSDHVSREEKIVIPIIGEILGAQATASMRTEHERIVELLRTLESHEPPTRIANNARPTALINHAVEIESLLRKHFSHEENVLYWFAMLHMRTG